MSDRLVSVVIPTFNRAYCLPRAVDSALLQTYRNVEVIVVDDGSTDNTRDLISKRYGGEARVRYHHQENTGIAGARNVGLALVSGDYVALLDSDDEWEPFKLEIQLACMRAHPELGMTWTDMIAIGPEGQILSRSYLRKMYSAYRWYPTPESLFERAEPLDGLSPLAREITPGKNFYYGNIGRQILMGNLVHTSTVVLTRKRAQAVKTFREDLRFAGEDYEFHLRTCRQGPVGYVDVATIRYQRGRSDQATAQPNRIHMAQNFLRVIEPILTTEENGAQDGGGLPRDMRQAVLAEAYAWVGEELLERGDAVGARRQLTRSLLRQPLQARTTQLLLASWLPTKLRGIVRRAYRAVKLRAEHHP